MESLHKLAFYHGKYYNTLEQGKSCNRYSTIITNNLYNLCVENKESNIVQVCCVFFKYNNNEEDFYYLCRCLDSLSIQSKPFSYIYLVQYESTSTMSQNDKCKIIDMNYIFKNAQEGCDVKKSMNIIFVDHFYRNNISYAKNSILYILAETWTHFGNSKLIQINMTNYKCVFTCDWNEQISNDLLLNKNSIVVGKIVPDQTWIKNMLYYAHSDFLNIFYKNKCENQSKFVYSENMCFYLQNIYKYVWWNTFIENDEMSDIYFSNLLQDKKIGIPVKNCQGAIALFTFTNNFYKYFYNIGKNYDSNLICFSN